MKRRIAAPLMALGMVAAVATPAYAASDSGYKSCSGTMDATVATRGYGIGVQTHVHNGAAFQTAGSTTWAIRNVNMGYKTANWSVSANSINATETYAYCPA